MASRKVTPTKTTTHEHKWIKGSCGVCHTAYKDARPDVSNLITIDDAHGEGFLCALCGAEDATLSLQLYSAVNRRAFAIKIGPDCRLHLESGLRAHRKWEIRGGAAEVKAKMQGEQ